MTPRAVGSFAREEQTKYEKARGIPGGKMLEYGEGIPHSYFRDLLYTELYEQERRRAMDSPSLRGQVTGLSREVLPRDFDIEAARLRVKTVARRAASAQFDLTTSTGSAMIPTSQLPPVLAQEFEVAVRSRAAVATALNVQPIPADTGMTVVVTQLSGGATVAMQTAENAAVSNTDPSFTLPSSAIGYGSGFVDCSRQLVDRSAEGAKVDQVIARELGRAAGELIDGQLLNGSGASGQITGLLGQSGIGSITFTNASPTPAALLSKIGEASANVSTNYGVAPDLLLWAPRRAAWALTQPDTTTARPAALSLFDSVVQAPAMPITLSSTQDAVIALRREAVHAFADTNISVHVDAESANLNVRFRVVCRVALVLGNGKAVAKINGSGLTTPTWAT